MRLSAGGKNAMAAPMPPSPPKLTREQRLAAQLRANLKRRKVQAKAIVALGSDDSTEETAPLPNDGPSG
jgi:hypothetical protein